MHQSAGGSGPVAVRGDGPGLLRAIEARLPDVRLLAALDPRGLLNPGRMLA